MTQQRLTCGLELQHVHDIQDAVQFAGQHGYDFACIPLVHPRFTTEHYSNKAAMNRPGPLTRPDLLLSSSDWNNLVVGVLSPQYTTNCDKGVFEVAQNSEQSLTQELLLATHLGISAVMTSLVSHRCSNLARILYKRILSGSTYQVWVNIPMVSGRDEAARYRSDMDPQTLRPENTWHWWNTFHSLADRNKKICLCLEISEDIPEELEIARWLGEPIRCVILPTDIWMTNKKGFPVLSQAHQNIVRRMHALHPQFVVSGQVDEEYVKYYQQYIHHILQISDSENMDSLQQYVRGYEDYLQCPLQPLMDNLESMTYEVFEKDPIKYQEYESAIYKALLDRVPDDKKEEVVTVIMVVGAGRGPLVRRALSASSRAGRPIKVYALEKNPNAVLTLHGLMEMEWADKDITLVKSDMRTWKAPEKADILVSELLGSFGDNELSPECLDGAQTFLKDDGISIPQSYTSFIAPLQSVKLHNEVRSCRNKDKHFQAHFESPYVVYLHNKNEISPSQPLFTFSHPNRAEVPDNRRHGRLQFGVPADGVMHAIGGYFETTLYKDVMLSIRPETHSAGMSSWFPILFPLKEPIPLVAGDVIDLEFWRCVNEKNVWYEWCTSNPIASSIHNPNGRSYTIGL